MSEYTEVGKFEDFLSIIRKEISQGITWYGRYFCPQYEEYTDAMWLKVDGELSINWEYRRDGSDIVFRKEER